MVRTYKWANDALYRKRIKQIDDSKHVAQWRSFIFVMAQMLSTVLNGIVLIQAPFFPCFVLTEMHLLGDIKKNETQY